MTKLRLSFETFPPKSETAHDKYLEMLNVFQAYNPEFVSMTYGAGASDRSRSESLIVPATGVIEATKFVPHLAGGGQKRRDIVELVSGWWALGIRHIVALRGDAGTGEGDIKCAADLVEIITSVAPFKVSVAGYPEIHPLSTSQDQELAHLKRKVEAGADTIITQFFFDPTDFLRYRDKCEEKGIKAKVIPGILPIGSLEQVSRFAGQCGATIPDLIRKRFAGLENHDEARLAVSVNTVVELVDHLQREGVEDFHLYTLNKTASTLAICHSLGIYPESKIAA